MESHLKQSVYLTAWLTVLMLILQCDLAAVSLEQAARPIPVSELMARLPSNEELSSGGTGYGAEEFLDQVIAVRGFLYRSENGKWVLADTPNLKSCCIGNTKNPSRQIYVEPIASLASSPGAATTLSGRLAITASTGVSPVVALRQAELVSEPARIHATGLFLFAGLFLAVAIFVLTARVMKA